MDVKELLTLYAKDSSTSPATFGDQDGLRKFMECEVKAVDEESRVVEFVGSDETVDRSGDVVSVEGWDLEQFKKNPVILFGHRYGEPPVGKALDVYKENGRLKFKVQFASAEEYPFADTVYRLVKGGYIKATSVGFIPKAWEDYGVQEGEEAGMRKPRRRYTKQELLELSVVSVPANPNALIAPKSVEEAVAKGIITMEEAIGIKKEEPAPAPPEDVDAYLIGEKAIGEVKALLVEFKASQDEILKLLRELLTVGEPDQQRLEAPGASPKGDSSGLYAGLLDKAKGFEEKVKGVVATIKKED